MWLVLAALRVTDSFLAPRVCSVEGITGAVRSEVLSLGPGTGGVRRPEVPPPGVGLRIAFFPSLVSRASLRPLGTCRWMRVGRAHRHMHTHVCTLRHAHRRTY